LRWFEEVLVDSATLCDYCIPPFTVLDLVVDPDHVGFPVQLQLKDSTQEKNEPYVLWVDASMTVSEMKRVVSEKEGVPVEAMTLYSPRDRVRDDEVSISDMYIQMTATISLSLDPATKATVVVKSPSGVVMRLTPPALSSIGSLRRLVLGEEFNHLSRVVQDMVLAYYDPRPRLMPLSSLNRTSLLPLLHPFLALAHHTLMMMMMMMIMMTMTMMMKMKVMVCVC
jgi:hypothetical protein